MNTHADENPLISLRRSAMDYLARREHSFSELLNKLSEKYPGFDRDEQIHPVLAKLKEQNLQSDERFVESYVRFRKNKGFGPVKIDAELYHKGVSRTLVSESIDAAGNNWLEQTRLAFNKKYADPDLASIREKQRYMRFLSQRGFRNEDIAAVLRLD